ncbi:MAG TPA: helicase-related protein, partial [Chloroflexia bacterium]
MVYNEESLAALEFAQHVKSRLLGNDDDQRLCSGQPSRVYDFGILFARSDAEASRQGDRSIFKPNAISARFEVPTHTLASLKLDIRPSFWLYFRSPSGVAPSPNPADTFDHKTLWQDWHERNARVQEVDAQRRVTGQQDQDVGRQSPADDESNRPFIRKRYSCALSGSPTQLTRANLDLEEFRRAWSWLGESPQWKGYVEVSQRPSSQDDRTVIEVRLINDYFQQGRRRGESAWFDVRMGIKVNCETLPVYCPLLAEEYRGIYVQTVNCVLAKHQTSIKQSVITVEQIGEVVRKRSHMIPAISFVEAADNPAQLLQAVRRQAAHIAGEKDPEHAEALLQACDRLEADRDAMKAFGVVTQTFSRSFSSRPDAAWHLHQASVLALAAVGYLDGDDILRPLVMNIPTAGGKTEAFVAAALWTIAYEAFHSNRLGTAIIKYPTTMLSDDQASRIARYIMEFDTVMGEQVRNYKPRGLGLFFGLDEPNADPQKRVGGRCPICTKGWNVVETLDGGSGRLLACPNKHTLFVSIQDEVFYMRPAIIIATLHKFVAKVHKGLMHTLLGGQGYWCEHKQHVTNKSYCSIQNRQGRWERFPHKPSRERVRITAVILDEAHLIREDTGALAAHFETHYLEVVRKLSERYPLVIVSTATIAHAEQHTWQLGLGNQPIIFPGKDRRNESVYYSQTDQVHHVILACMPRGRAIAWAVPHLINEYMSVFEGDPKRYKAFRPPMIYCPSYLTRDQVNDGVRRQVSDPRKNKGLPELVVDEFSRQRFGQDGQDAVLKRLREGVVDLVLSTNIASVGVDLPDLNSILYFGVPTNISEFIQSLNRVARRPDQPGVAFLVLDPYKERDNSYYAYLEPFAQYPHRIVEAVPL